MVALSIRRQPRTGPAMLDLRVLVVFTLLAVIALPVLSVATMAGLAQFTLLRDASSEGWANVAMAQAIGYALYVPAWCSLNMRASALRHAGGVDIGFAILLALAAVMLVILWYAYGDVHAYRPLLCLAPAPIVMAAILMAQIPGGSISMFIIAMIAAHMAARGHGPFAVPSAQDNGLALQVWCLLAAVMSLAVGVVVEQRIAGKRYLVAAHAELREMAGRLIATQEQERARLARDLHDDINQRLAAAAIELSTLRRELGTPQGERLQEVQGRIVGMCEDVRQLSHQLHPSCLQHTGLRSALQSLCRHPAGHAWPAVTLLADDLIDDLPPEIALCFYRVAQEALSNAVRHAQARKVSLRAMVDDGVATLRVRDDGNGFGTALRGTTSTGIGIISMQERAKLLGGSFLIDSKPGKGVDVCIRIPMTPM
jgi:signal transduction histidine kinase